VFELVRVPEPLKRLQQRLVDDDRRVLRVVDDEAQLVRVKPRVQRVDDRADRRDREIGLEVLGLVPHQRRNSVAVADA
jgi:hypothetical protein